VKTACLRRVREFTIKKTFKSFFFLDPEPEKASASKDVKVAKVAVNIREAIWETVTSEADQKHCLVLSGQEHLIKQFEAKTEGDEAKTSSMTLYDRMVETIAEYFLYV